MSTMDAQLLELARTADPTVLGRRIREARISKGLNQSQVAGDEMSTGYVSRIESGTRRPDPELLAVISERVGVAVVELVTGTTPALGAELKLRLDWAELSLKTGDAVGALRQVDQILATLPDSSQADLRRAALRLKAGALETTSDSLDDAIMMLEDLTAAGPLDLDWLADMGSLSRCLRNSGDLTRGIEVGEQALARVAGLELDGGDEAVSLAMSVAASYFERGDTGVAVRMIRRTTTTAELLGSPESRAKVYWNASIVESRSGDAEAALLLARKALNLLESVDDFRNLARLRSQLGLLALRADEPDAAEALTHLKRAEIELKQTDANAYDLAANRLHQAEAQFLLGHTDEARSDARAAKAAGAEGAPLVVAQACVILGRIAISEDQEADAQQAYQEAALHLTSAGADKAAAQLWFELGTLLEDAADTIGALNAYRRAGASSGLRTADRSTRTAASRAGQSSRR